MKNPTIETQMMIRKPVAEVFNAFIDPAVTTKFWFTKSSGKLEEGKTINWEWEMYGATATVKVLKVTSNRLISVQWGHPPTTVDYEFTELTNGTTYVVIKNYGFNLSGDALIEAIKDNTGGFTTVLDAAKFYLEHGIKPNLVADKFLKK